MYHFLIGAQQVLGFCLWGLVWSLCSPLNDHRSGGVDPQIRLASRVTNGPSVGKGVFPGKVSYLKNEEWIQDRRNYPYPLYFFLGTWMDSGLDFNMDYPAQDSPHCRMDRTRESVKSVTSNFSLPTIAGDKLWRKT